MSVSVNSEAEANYYYDSVTVPGTSWGTVTANKGDVIPSSGVAQVMDGQTTKYWASMGNPRPAMTVTLNTASVVSMIGLMSGNDHAWRDPKTIEIEASNNNSSWTTIEDSISVPVWSDPVSSNANRQEWRFVQFSNTNSYKYYRIHILSTGGNEFQLTEMQLYRRNDKDSSISISNLVARKRLKNPDEEVYTDASLGNLADWHSKNSWPTGPNQELSPLNVGADVSMEDFGPDDAHKVSTCIHYMMIKPETQDSYVSGYDTITSTLGDAEVKFRVRGFRNDGDGYASVQFYHPTGQAAQAANPYDQTITGVGTTTATAAHFQNLGGTNTGTIGFHMDVRITYYNEAGEVGVTTWNRNQIGESGGAAGFGAENWYEIYPENHPAGTFNAGHCLVFIQGPQCSSHRWSGSITPVKDTFSDWMICHGEQMMLSVGNGAGRPDGYQDAVGSPNRHGTTA
jgi:hypothetical protein